MPSLVQIPQRLWATGKDAPRCICWDMSKNTLIFGTYTRDILPSKCRQSTLVGEKMHTSYAYRKMLFYLDGCS